jgi:hypothetical protein
MKFLSLVAISALFFSQDVLSMRVHLQTSGTTATTTTTNTNTAGTQTPATGTSTTPSST